MKNSINLALVIISSHCFATNALSPLPLKNLLGPNDTKVVPSLDLLSLNSLPNSEYVIYLDFNGKYNDKMVWYLWNIISEDYRPFDVNVTTSLSVYDSTPLSKKVKLIYDPKGGDSGICSVSSFGTTNGQFTCFSNTSNVTNFLKSNVGTHEIGHSFGLSHDGAVGQPGEYTQGNSIFVPILGYMTNKSYFGLFSKGDYPLATNQEDDYAIINQSLPYRNDDHSNTINQATPLLTENDSVPAILNTGVIHLESDVDVFEFNSLGGEVNLYAIPTDHWGNLHTKMSLLDKDGNTLIQGSPILSDSSSEFQNGWFKQSGELDGISLPNPYILQDDPTNDFGYSYLLNASGVSANLDSGKYYIQIENNFIDGAYTKYSSRGSYQLKGHISNTGVITKNLVQKKTFGITAKLANQPYLLVNLNGKVLSQGTTFVGQEFRNNYNSKVYLILPKIKMKYSLN